MVRISYVILDINSKVVSSMSRTLAFVDITTLLMLFSATIKPIPEVLDALYSTVPSTSTCPRVPRTSRCSPVFNQEEQRTSDQLPSSTYSFTHSHDFLKESIVYLMLSSTPT